VISLTEKLQQDEYERKQMKAELDNEWQQKLDALRATRQYHVLSS